jgi:O-antigen chain-terminating methyltransferase
MWPHDIFLAFFIFVDEVAHARMGGADLLRTAAISPYRLPPPYRQWGLAFWATPTNQWSFRLMVQLFVRLDDLPETPALTENLPLPLWMGVIEEGAGVLTWFVRSLQGQQFRLEQHHEQREQRAKQLQAGQDRLAEQQQRLQDEWTAAQTQRQGQWEAALARIDELQQLSHRCSALVEQRNRELQDVYASRSWRLTRPLRQAAQYLLPRVARIFVELRQAIEAKKK